MPLKKHRQMLKMYHDCFTGYDAVEWLHQLLKKNQNFGPHVRLHCLFEKSFVFCSLFKINPKFLVMYIIFFSKRTNYKALNV